jgi:hypothetical protein
MNKEVQFANGGVASANFGDYRIAVADGIFNYTQLSFPVMPP